MDVTKIKKKIKESEKLRKEGKKLVSKADKLMSEARDQCPHTVTETHDEYFEGTYLDKARTVTYKFCAICGKQLDSETTMHSWYG